MNSGFELCGGENTCNFSSKKFFIKILNWFIPAQKVNNITINQTFFVNIIGNKNIIGHFFGVH